jgi:hypothetical protein
MVRVLRLLRNALFVQVERDHHCLFNEVSGVNHCVGVELAVIFDLREAILVCIQIRICFKIGVSKATVDRVSKLLATHAPDVFLLLNNLFSCKGRVLTKIIVILTFVLSKLATKLILFSLAAAPPHFTSPI